MGSNEIEIIERLKRRSQRADEMIAVLRNQIAALKRVAMTRAFSDEIGRLKRDNDSMTEEVEQLKQRLVRAEVRNGVKQYLIPGNEPVPTQTNAQPEVAECQQKVDGFPAKSKAKDSKPAAKTPGAPKAPAAAKTQKPPEDEAEPDVSRLDLRVGLIVSAKKHPDADSLYVEDVDLGGDDRRTVVSGLVRFVPVEAMQNRLAVLLCNLKPAKMRGVTSQAMVMCASTPEAVEILVPPAGSVPGDRVVVVGFPGQPDKELNPKKKIFERVAPHLKTDANLVATYKGSPWSVTGKGVVVAPSLANVQIK